MKMKSAEQWQEELAGETSIESIREIQKNALIGAMTILTDYKQSRADAASELATAIEDLH